MPCNSQPSFLIALSAILATSASVRASPLPEIPNYSLHIDGTQTIFNIAVNTVPIGLAQGRKLAGAIFYLDPFLHPGNNIVTIKTISQSAYATLNVTLDSTLADDPPQQLANQQCGLVQPNGTTPACKSSNTLHLTMVLKSWPDLQLWHAQPATPSPQVVAKLLASEQAVMSATAAAHKWVDLFLGQNPRKADLLALSAVTASQAQDMADYMQKASSANPGSVVSATPPNADQLSIEPLPDNLFLVTRRDHTPILRVQVGASQTQDPEDFGDFADRYLDGIYQQPSAIIGLYDGSWKRVR